MNPPAVCCVVDLMGVGILQQESLEVSQRMSWTGENNTEILRGSNEGKFRVKTHTVAFQRPRVIHRGGGQACQEFK
jgi:hypothetical protein